MYAVIFEVTPPEAGKKYLEFAANLRKFLKNQPGFISIERFQSLVEENKVLSLSFWEDEASIETWRNVMDHRTAQKSGKDALFKSYRIRPLRARLKKISLIYHQEASRHAIIRIIAI